MDLPQDDFILLSFINTKLRDDFSSLVDFCDCFGCSQEDICRRMEKIGYFYDAGANAFK